MLSVPSVTTVAGTRPNAMSKPLRAPRSAPRAHPNRNTKTRLMVGCSLSRSAVVNAERPRIEPTERSTLRVRMTSVSPTATMAMIATDCRVCSRLLRARNRGCCTHTKTMMTASTTSRPASRTCATRAASRARARDAARVGSVVVGTEVSLSMYHLPCRLPHRCHEHALLVSFIAFELAAHAPLVHDQDAIGHREHLWQFT